MSIELCQNLAEIGISEELKGDDRSLRHWSAVATLKMPPKSPAFRNGPRIVDLQTLSFEDDSMKLGRISVRRYVPSSPMLEMRR